MNEQDPMWHEWIAWRRLCATLKKDHAVEINDAERLNAAITAWGEELVRLRCGQEARLRHDILIEKRDDVERLLGDIVITGRG